MGGITSQEAASLSVGIDDSATDIEQVRPIQYLWVRNSRGWHHVAPGLHEKLQRGVLFAQISGGHDDSPMLAGQMHEKEELVVRQNHAAILDIQTLCLDFLMFHLNIGQEENLCVLLAQVLEVEEISDSALLSIATDDVLRLEQSLRDLSQFFGHSWRYLRWSDVDRANHLNLHLVTDLFGLDDAGSSEKFPTHLQVDTLQFGLYFTLRDEDSSVSADISPANAFQGTSPCFVQA
mmetsp:Transcript_57144/g.121476  ORF Transcript_57144/g.121476 Transcript_57144/m.121476 type:complete len:235 (-) Transcript_57144:530-1234(-)